MAKTILIADDNENVRTILKLSLSFRGYTILEVEDGAAVFDVLEKTHVDLIISDLAMPQVNGYELLARLRADPRYAAMPFVLCSAEKQLSADDVIRRGANACLAKPCPPTQVMELVESLIGQA